MKKMKLTETNPSTRTIYILFNSGETCEFTYTDSMMAEEHYLVFSTQMVIAGQVIKRIRLE
jgi:hypothetical protein